MFSEIIKYSFAQPKLLKNKYFCKMDRRSKVFSSTCMPVCVNLCRFFNPNKQSLLKLKN